MHDGPESIVQSSKPFAVMAVPTRKILLEGEWSSDRLPLRVAAGDAASLSSGFEKRAPTCAG
jgi:hypothetical protein